MMFILAVAIIVTGIILPTLPDLPNGLVPWAIVFVPAVAYPLVLSGVFRRNRADYEFRLLHWIPAIILLVWMVLQGIAYVWPLILGVLDWFTWGWSLPAVATGFLLIILFVFKVIRRWSTRLLLLALAFVPFMVGSVANEYYNWTPQITATLWQGEWWQLDTTLGTPVASNDGRDEGKNLSASADPTEEQYRERLRAIERRRERIEQRLEGRGLDEGNIPTSSEMAAMVSETSPSSESTSSAPMLASSSSLPSQLPSSGFGWSAMAMLLLAAYCAAVQRKTIMRVDS